MPKIGSNHQIRSRSLILTLVLFMLQSSHCQVMLTRITQRALAKSLTKLPCAYFSGGHHEKPFDWRDDHALNPYYELDPRQVGTQDPFTYSYPFEGKPTVYSSPWPTNYNPKDLTTNFVGTFPLLSVAQTNPINVPDQNVWDDLMHEYDYRSQDFDFQPETFKSQHFRKRGHLWMWAIIGFCPIWYVLTEMIYLQWVDGEQFKYQRPPPLNYPDEQDTPDTECYQTWKSNEFIYLWDAGILRDPYFQIIDGKKVYSKWSGVNQPGVVIKPPQA